jgi:NADP-dependent 3-hydroxy acid dehydrogenase YdfG
MKGRWAVVTGASAGIGEATARGLAKTGVNLILLARRRERLEKLKASITEEFSVSVKTASLDVTDREAVGKWADSVKEPVEILINNAGLARGTDKVQEASLDDWEAMIDTNVKGLLFLTRALLPGMIERRRGHIVNIGSVAGRWVYPGGAVYCASKFAVRALSEGMRLDLSGTPIRVTNIEPGMVETEFSEVRLQSSERAKAVYKNMIPLSASDIAESIVWCLERPAHVNIQELVIFPTDQASVGVVHRR